MSSRREESFLREQFSLALPERGIVRFGEFRLSSGSSSPYYLDARLLRSFPDLFVMAVGFLEREIEKCRFHYIADVPTGVTPLVSALAYKKKIPMISPREPKTHGTMASIEGVYREGCTAVLIEDVVTRGGSVAKAIAILQSGGVHVYDLIVLFDREQGGVEKLRNTCNVRVVFSISQEIERYLKHGKITKDNYAAVKNMLLTQRQ